ncbi:DinB family protein [Nocardioides coralli]|nr:DinB family protein [Nocardioides coralli]
METEKEILVRYLQAAREAILWKLEGLDDYDVRRPLTPTGTNLLGLVKHLASVELGYFVGCFGRQIPVALPWYADDAEPNADMWATEEESRDDVVGLYHLAWAEAAKTFEELDLDAEGTVPWWPAETNRVPLRLLLIHVIADTNRHAGHADILREGLDGSAGLRRDVSNLPDEVDWPAHVARLEAVAVSFADEPTVDSSSPEEVARARVLADYALEEESLRLVRERDVGDAAAVAVTFDGPDGRPRQGFVGLDRRSDGLWRTSAGFMSGPVEAEPDDVFAANGGWGNGRRSVHGGWVADPDAVTARLLDTSSGDVVDEDQVIDGVAILIAEGGHARRDLQAELYDAEGRRLRSGPVTGRH